MQKFSLNCERLTVPGQGMMIKMISYSVNNVGDEGEGDGDNKEEKEEKFRNTKNSPFLVP